MSAGSSVEPGPKPSTSMSGGGHQPHQNEGAKKPNIDQETTIKIMKFIEKRRAMPKKTATTLVPKEISDAELEEFYDRMTCQDCGYIPHQRRRYLCARGHFYCVMCMEEREKRYAKEHPEENSKVAICGYKMFPPDLNKVGYAHGSIPPGAELTDKEMERMEEERKQEACLFNLRHLDDADPMYFQLFGNTVWKCPYQNVGKKKGPCNADGAPGWIIHRHIRQCYDNNYFSRPTKGEK